jgi:type I restriction enzyme, S subunit
MSNDAAPRYLTAADARDLPPGFKSTEVGLMPVEWSVQPLLNALRLPRGQVDPRREPFRSMVLVAPDHVESNTGRLLTRQTAAEQGAVSGKYIFKCGDIVYSKIRPYLRKAILADIDGLCSADMYPLAATPGVSPGFMLAVLLGRRFSVFAEAVSARSGIPKINRNELAEFQVALPPPAEQRAIAEALSDVDALVGALEALIAKKRAIKDAVMQELLTGKARLPGFSEEWGIRRLGEIGYFLKGSGVKRDEAQSGPLACVRYGEIYTTHHDYVRMPCSWISPEVAAYATRLEYGDLLFTGSGETKEEIGKCVAFVIDTEAYAGGDIIILRPKEVDSLFLGYALNMPAVARQKASLGQGDAVVHIGSSALAQISVSFPSIAEQTAIAIVLSDMDAEITALEARRDKTRAIKQGMMQQLLTGRVRLVEPEAAA